MQDVKSNGKARNYYSSVEQIFRELSRQVGTKIPIPAKAKEIDFSIEKPLTNQEKENYYELNLYISTFVLEETLFDHTGRLQIIIKPPTTQRAEPHIEETHAEQQEILSTK